MKIYGRNKYGGEVIGAGGYGCVFKPALKCVNQKKRTNGISKMSVNNESEKEWNELNRVKKYIEKIPDYKKYFLVSGLNRCRPAKLTKKDKENLYRCNHLFGSIIDINPDNINNNLDAFHIINMPYGGKNLHNILEHREISISKINKILINLLLNGIIPMNRLNIYHFDVKADNMLYNKNLVRIIDFGEMGISTPEQIIPDTLFNRMILFNNPFSRILFGSIFDNFLMDYLETNPLSSNTQFLFKELHLLALTFYTRFKSQFGEGHEKFINTAIILNIFRLNKSFAMSEYNILDNLVSIYCAKILMKYLDIDKKRFDSEKYFREVYSKNVDVYGFIMSYVPIIMQNPYNLKKNYNKKQEIIVANIIIKYCLSHTYADIPINISELINDLKELNMEKKSIKTTKSKKREKEKKTKKNNYKR